MVHPGKRKALEQRDDHSPPKEKRRRGGRPSRQVVGGPGIFMSCLRGKERKASAELIDYLDDIADRIYPGVVPQERIDSMVFDSKVGTGEVEDDLDALMNGAASAALAFRSQQSLEPVGAKEKTTERAEELDIEAQIRAELEELHPEKHTEGPARVAHQRQEKVKFSVRRFVAVDTGIECFTFISVAPPLDPVTLTRALLEDVEKTRETRGRFALRLTPVRGTCAANVEDIETYASKTLSGYFPSGDGVGKTFKIEPRIRSHTVLKRDGLIQLIAGAIPKDGGHRADFKSSGGAGGYYIVVEVFKNVCAIAPLADYDRFRKYNPGEIAKAAESQAIDSSRKKEGLADTLVEKEVPAGPQIDTAPVEDPKEEHTR